jgi:hypothetical protein
MWSRMKTTRRAIWRRERLIGGRDQYGQSERTSAIGPLEVRAPGATLEPMNCILGPSQGKFALCVLRPLRFRRSRGVGLRGLEPLTSSLSGKRSNRLSYRPGWIVVA